MRIAIDAMGGDNAPYSVIDACVELSKQGLPDFSITLIGDKKVLAGKVPSCIEICHAEEVIEMHEHPIEAFRKKKKSSIAIGTKLQKEKKVDAFVGAGNTGAYIVFATFTLGRLAAVKRPVLATFFPTRKEHPALVLDVGANANSKPLHLYQFGVMGSLYVEKIKNKRNPSVALLSMGEEDIKGNSLTIETFGLLKASKLNFIGNIEGHQILEGDCDVIVCDGSVGNAILKFGESIIEIIQSAIKQSVTSSIRAKLGGALLLPSLKSFFSNMSYDEYGGVPLLGVNGVTIMCHGRSNAKAIKNAVLTAAKCVKEDVNTHIEQEFSKHEI